ncbi:MAG: carbon-nitrogen hydrolase family protein [Pseudomonadota bacterium]
MTAVTATTPTVLKAGLIQMRSGRDVERNLADAEGFIREAADHGATYIQTPEVTVLMERERTRLFALTQAEENNEALRRFAALAAELRIWLHIGSMCIRLDETQLANRAFVFAPDGTCVARYDKIHMFDVTLPGGESYKESKRFKAGTQIVNVTMPWGKLGVTICYDLRFPHVYRTLARAGAHVLTAPSAFTKKTGEAHWHALLRARAIECGAFVLAAAQGGRHENGRDTYGHSLAVSPWGEVLAEGLTEPGVIMVDLDLSAVEAARRQIPSLDHDRPFEVVERAHPDAKRAAS